MNKRGLFITAIGLVFCMGLTGCASMPDLSEKENEMVSQYAAGLLLKYDSANHSRLVDYEPYVNLYENALKRYKEQEQAYYDELALEEARKQYQEEQNAAKEDGSSNSQSKPDNNGGATVVDARSIGDVIGASSFDFEYCGNVSTDMYPEDADNLSLVITSTQGKDLLVTYFNVTNNSGSTETLDLVSNDDVMFKLSVNGGRYYSVLKTFVLEDDLSMYYGDFASGETKRLALILEVPDGTVVSTLGLRISTSNDSITKSLK